MSCLGLQLRGIRRLGRPGRVPRPPLSLEDLQSIFLRLNNKGTLSGNKDLDKVFINADEDIETRRAKSFLRKAAFNANKAGEVVIFRHNLVTINGIPYSTNDVEKIPAKYLKHGLELTTSEEGERPQARAHTPDAEMDVGEAPKMETTKEGLIRRGERMRVTRKGLCFSGPSSYLSNMAYVPIVYKKKAFESNEQGFQWNKVMDHKMAPIANDIKTTEDSYRVKTKGGKIAASPEWNLKAPGILEEMFIIKIEEHPELLERLLDTYPLDLIEACTDDKWGGGPLRVKRI